VHVQGSEGLLVERCTFTRLDNTALLLSRHNRRASLIQNEFVWLGQSAMAAWGETDGVDGTGGDQPRGTQVVGNLCHEIGHYQKQSSCWFQAKTALTTLRGNLFFNGPRALVNFNDGFGGGNVVEHNLMFNACRDSGDHGPFNSWDRQPFLTEVRNGTPSLLPAWNELRRNFVIANYNANGGCFDNDDGSSWYDIHHNVCWFGGHKSTNGFSKRTHDNLNIFPQVYGAACAGMFGLPKPTLAGTFDEGFYNNTCILEHGADGVYFKTWETFESMTPPKAPKLPIVLWGNRLYSGGAGVTVCMGGTHPISGCRNEKDEMFTMEQWLEKGLDHGTQYTPQLPSDDQIMTWVNAMAGLGRVGL